MARNGRFWRNVTLIALAHVAVIVELIRWSLAARNSSNPHSIVWLSGAQDLATEQSEAGESSPTEVAAASPEPEASKPDEAEEKTPVVRTAKSEIELPMPTPKPTATAKPSPRPLPKPTAKKPLLAKASPKPSPRAKPNPTKSGEKAEKAAD